MKPDLPLQIALLYAAQDGQCFHCSKPMLRTPATRTEDLGWTREHVIPLCKGGRRRHRNVVLAHATCNQRRGDRDLTPAELDRAQAVLRRADGVRRDDRSHAALLQPRTYFDPGPGEPRFNPDDWLKSRS